MDSLRTDSWLVRYLNATEIAYWGFVVTPVIFVRLLPLSVSQSIFILLAVAASIMIGLLAYHRLIPRVGITVPIRYLLMVTMLSNVAAVGYILKPYGVDIDVFLVVIAASTGIYGSLSYAIHTSLMVSGIDALLTLSTSPVQPYILVVAIIRAIVIVFTGIISHTLSAILLNHTQQAERQNRHLSMLLQSSNVSSRVDDMKVMLTMQAEAVAVHTPVTACRISVINPDRESITTFGAYPIYPIDEPSVGIGATHRINDLPYLQEVINDGQTRLLYGEEVLPLVDSKDNRVAFFYYGVKTLILIPLNAKTGSVGILCVGECEDYQGRAYDNEKMHLLQTLANQIASSVESHLALQSAQRVAQRLAMANQIAKAISSTIEMDDLLELLYQQLQQAIPSDTYYVGLYHGEENQFEMRVLIDEGVRYPPATIEMGDGFASWVMTHRRPLLMNDISRDTLPAKPIGLGGPRVSDSYLGVPMIASDRVIGILALASYTAYAFDNEDRALLLNVASQAALSIDNARQHAEVKEQARRDPLTGAYNHGHLLHLLSEAVEGGRTNQSPVSLIMLDIDYFKQYNDRYGHIVGDQVLTELVRAVLAHVKRTDIVGRWGGEEFSVGLPGANTEQALTVAERIRSTMAETAILDRAGKRVPSPTVSQGIATFPLHAQDAFGLVDIADQALYVAKNSGRDQVRTAKTE